jgi:SlyX protein
MRSGKLAGMDENRLIELETRLAFQDDTLRQLNEVITDQQTRIGELERICRHLIERVARLGDGGQKGSLEDEVPPHY